APVKFGVSILWPGAANHRDLNLFVLCQRGEITEGLEFMEGRTVGRRGRIVVHQDAMARSLETLSQIKPGRFFDDMGIRLIREAKNCDGLAVQKHCMDLVE